jgi:hypothetical protein
MVNNVKANLIIEIVPIDYAALSQVEAVISPVFPDLSGHSTGGIGHPIPVQLHQLTCQLPFGIHWNCLVEENIMF